MSCDDSDYDSSSSSSSSDESDIIPDFDPPLFPHGKQHLSAAYKLQVGLNNLLDKNKASIGMYNEIVTLFNAYLSSPNFSPFARLKSRKLFIKESEKLFSIAAMKPINENVKLTDNTLATVPVFDAKTMILSLLHDPSLMREENFAEGYDIFRGDELDGYECNNNYGEIHTGDAWQPALRRFCGDYGDLKSLIDIMKRGGIRTTVLGRQVHIKIWIHYIIGDTEGNNKWLGHYPGNNSGIVRPYRDCECSFCELS